MRFKGEIIFFCSINKFLYFSIKFFIFLYDKESLSLIFINFLYITFDINFFILLSFVYSKATFPFLSKRKISLLCKSKEDIFILFFLQAT